MHGSGARSHGASAKQQARGGHPMHAWYLPVKVFALVVVLLMVVAMVYAGTMAVMYWTGIGV